MAAGNVRRTTLLRRGCLGPGLLVLVGMGALAIRDEVRVRGEAEAARRDLAAGRLDAASARLDRWLRARPGAAEAYYLRARLALAAGRPADLEAAMGRARALGYPGPPLERLRAFHLVRAGRFDEAEPILRRVLAEARRPDPEADEALALGYLQTFKLREAAAVLDRWARDAPADPRPYLWWTEIDRRTRAGTDAAIAHYRDALGRAPEDERARLGLAETLLAAHRLDEAAPAFDRYLARRPDDPAARTGAGLVALERGDLATATRHLDRALAIDPDRAAALAARARVDLRRGVADEALRRLDRAARIDPNDVAIHYARGLALDRLGRSADGRDARLRADRLKADQDRLIALRDRLDADPGNDRLRVEIARWMFAHGQDDQGVRWARTVADGRPGHPEASRVLAEHYRRSGELGLANYYRAQASGGP